MKETGRAVWKVVVVDREGRWGGFVDRGRGGEGRRGTGGRAGRVKGKGKKEGQFPMRTVKLFHNAFQSTSARMNSAVVCIC